MYVCLCYGISDSDIRRAAADGARSLADLSARTGCATSCGCCADLAAELISEETARNQVDRGFPLRLVAAA